MNIQNSVHEDRLKKMLLRLNLSGNNQQLALDYLLTEQEDASLLEQLEPVNFRLIGMETRVLVYQTLHPLRVEEKLDQLARFYKLFWAMGKSTATYLLASPFPSGDDRKDWQIRILGKTAVAAMRAESLSQSNNPYLLAPWLWELAETEPEILLAAMDLCGDSVDGRMKMILAGMLLCGGELEPEMSNNLTGHVLAGVISRIPTAIPGTSAKDQALLIAYILAGDPTAPLPQLSLGSVYAQGRKDFWQIHYGDDYLVRLLGAAAFMAQNRDPRARCAVRLFLALNPRIVMLFATQVVPRHHFRDQLSSLLEDLPGGKATMLLFLTGGYSWMEQSWRRTIALRCADALPQVLKDADPNQLSALTELLPEAVKSIGVNMEEEIVRYLEGQVDSGGDELRDYLTGTGSLADTAVQLKPVTYTGYNQPYQLAKMIRGHRLAHGWDDFALRCAVTLGLVFKAFSLRTLLSEEKGAFVPTELTDMCRALQEKGLPLTEHLNLLGYLNDALYADEYKKAVSVCMSALLLPENQTGELCRAARDGILYTRQIAIRTLNRLNTEEAKRGILACTGDSAKAVRNLLTELLPEHPEWAPEYTELLKSRKAADRILAATVLGRLGDAGTQALQQALETEKNAKVTDAIQNALGAAAKPPVTGTEELVQNTLKSNRLKKIQWLLDVPLPKVCTKGDTGVSGEELLQAMLIVHSELGRIGKCDAAEQIAEILDARDLERAADEVFERWIAAGAPAKQKWVLAFSAVYGGEPVCRKLIRAINDWPQNARGAIACDGVKALTLSSAPGALLAVDAISRKFKFRQVKTAAAAALDSAAQELGITVEELADRIVPDLGFDPEGKRVFDYGKRSFTVRLTPSLELEITADSGKKVKNLPAPGKTDDEQKAGDAYEQFKAMKKQIRSAVTTQKARMESALASLRCWDTDRWKALFVGNPIMHQFAISLVWGVYRDGVLTDTFRYMEDGSFNTVDEEEYELLEGASIGLVHPVELSEDLLSGWKQQLEDYEVIQSIQQLDRPVYTLTPELENCRELELFGGKKLNGLSLAGKLTGQGWYRGSVVDGGAFYTFWREDLSLGMGVELRFSGSFIGDENEDVTVYDAVFYKSGTVTRGSYNYDAPKEEHIFPLNRIPARYYSEIIQQLTKATASSSETDPGWKTDRRDR